MSHGTRRLLLAETMLLLAPATVLVALGFAWSARFLAASVRNGNWPDPTTWMSLTGNGRVFAIGLLAVLPLAHLWKLRKTEN